MIAHTFAIYHSWILCAVKSFDEREKPGGGNCVALEDAVKLFI